MVGNTDSDTKVLVGIFRRTDILLFSKIRCDDHFAEVNASLEDFAGYIQTWSGFQKFQATEGNEKAEQVIKDFLQQ